MSDEPIPSTDFVIADRRGQDRRGRPDRRKREIPVAVERRAGGADRRQERRRQVDPTTCEKEYSDDEIIFMKAMDQYKRANRRPFPTWSEVLEVLRSLGAVVRRQRGKSGGHHGFMHQATPVRDASGRSGGWLRGGGGFVPRIKPRQMQLMRPHVQPALEMALE